MKHKVWNIPSAVSIPEELIRAGYTPLLAAVLASRGVTTVSAAASFLEGGVRTLEDPLLLTDMDAAVRRIERARQNGEKVAVYGDYDVDGITSACLLTEYLRGIGIETEIYIPDRMEEGYGLNTGAIERLRDMGVSLIITVDCGVTAVGETDYAASLGMDMLITDHHECQAELPRAVAVVDPKRPDGRYPSRDLAGVGVAFKLVCALSGDSAAMLERFADLVAVGTVADVMPLTGENRYIVKTGLEKLRAAPRAGLAALMAEAGVTESRLNAMSIGFTLAPRINAAGRLGRVAHAAKLMMEHDPEKARRLAAELCDMNRERQQLEASIWEEAVAMLDGQTPTGPIVLAGQGWHQGVIGIAASRLAETYSVPAVIISLDGDHGKGSCRSYGGFNLFDALGACGDLLEGFGGHALAAGLNIRGENVDAFRAKLAECYANYVCPTEEGLPLDLVIGDRRMLTMKCVESLEALEPCGNENPRPLFALLDAQLLEAAPIGGGKHVRLKIEKFGQSFDCVWFSHSINELGLSPMERVDAAFYPQVSEFRGRRNVQLVLQDLRKADVAGLCRRILREGDAPGVAINRGDLARVWRSLEELSPLRIGIGRLGKIEHRLPAARIALGLRVLWELDLAEIRFAEEENVEDIYVMSTDKGIKADLMQSAAWRKHHY